MTTTKTTVLVIVTTTTMMMTRNINILTLTTNDDVKIAAAHVAPAAADDDTAATTRRPAVLLIHGGGANKERWWKTDLVRRLHAQQTHVLAIDIRRHGRSEDGDLFALQRDPTLAHHEVVAGYDWLRSRDDVNPKQIIAIGSSYGSNLLAFILTTLEIELAGAVLLSPTRAARLFIDRAEKTHAVSVPTLIMCCTLELPRYEAAATAEFLKPKLAHDDSEVVVQIGSAHGAGILTSIPGAPDHVARWMRDRLPAPHHAPDHAPDQATEFSEL